MTRPTLSRSRRRKSVVLPLLVLCVVSALYAVVGGRLGRISTSAPSPQPVPVAWTPLNPDPRGECGSSEAGRDGVESFWALDRARLLLRLCTVGQPGWSSPTDGSFVDARYKWWLSTDAGHRMILVEDYPRQGAPGADGAGEVTFIDDRNGNGRFTDDWARLVPPAYLNNSIGSPLWRRAWSTRSGPQQASSAGSVGDVGFSLGPAACGWAVDVYVSTRLLGEPDRVCVAWATDPEVPDLDARPSCDTGPSQTCFDLSGGPGPTASPTTAAHDRTPTFTPTTPAPAADTPTSTFTPTPSRTATPTATVTLEPPASATHTDTPVATEEPTATSSPSPSPSATSTDTSPQPSATPSASATATATQLVEPTPTIPASATHTAAATAGATSSPTATPSVTASTTPGTGPLLTPTRTPSTTATATPGYVDPTPSATTGGTPITPPASPTPGPGPGTPPLPPGPPDVGCLTVCLRDMSSGQSTIFPEQATVHAVLLTAYGSPAQPAISVATDSTGCASFPGLEPGQYRVWATVPSGWTLYPGSTSPQTVWIYANQPCSQVVFRYQRGGSGPPPFPPGTPGPMPSPPGFPTATSEPTPYPPSPDRPNVGAMAHLPILSYMGSDAVCTAWVEAQNVGDRPAKALLIVWGPPGFCPPQCSGPLKVECSGLLRPGSAWHFLGAQMPSGAKSGLVVSAGLEELNGDIFADALCETLYFSVVGDCDAYRRFRKAYEEQGFWSGFDFGLRPAQPIAVEVLRACPGDTRPSVRVHGSYTGIAEEYLGHWDPVFGGFAYFAPSLYATTSAFNSILYIQNAGYECTSVELWFKAQGDCLRPRICDVLTLAPGETHQFDSSSCVGPGWTGGAWLRSSQPLAIAVDHIGSDVLMTYTGQPSELNYTFNGSPLYTTGSAVAYGPLVYSEFQGWDTAVVVQNLSGVTAAKVKVYFLDRSGGVITTLADWVCPQGSQTFYLPVIANLPGNWVGAVRVESQDWFTPGGPAVAGPNLQAVAQLVQYSDIARSDAQEAIAYNLFPEQLAFDWQLGSGNGGLASGVGRIGIPSFIKDRTGTGVTSELAIANVVSKPGLTNFAMFIFDQNGLIDYVCEALSSGQVEYIDLANWGFIHPGFRGSCLISATFWEHEVFDYSGGFTRNLVGLAAVKVERSGTTLASPIPGDESAGNAGFAIPGPLPFTGPAAPRCPGQPGHYPPSLPTATSAIPTPGPPPGTLPPPPIP